LSATDEEVVGGATALPNMNAKALVPMDVGLIAVIVENLLLSHVDPPRVVASMVTTPKPIFYYNSRQTTTAN
jgi:hypothetical protein